MKTTLTTIYAIFVSVVIVLLLYIVTPFVTEYPKTATVILALFMLTSIGTGLRSLIEVGILTLMLKIAHNNTKHLVLCPVVFGVGLLAAVVVPWIYGISDWGVWQWIASIVFTLFNLETFYAFMLATLRVYNENK